MAEWVFYRGGPKDGQVLLGERDAGFLVFDDRRPWAYYRLTDETAQTDRGRIPVAEYVGEHPPTNA